VGVLVRLAEVFMSAKQMQIQRTVRAERIARRAVLRIVLEHDGAWGGLLGQLDELQAIIAEEIEAGADQDLTKSSCRRYLLPHRRPHEELESVAGSSG